MSYNQEGDHDYLMVKVDNQSNIKLISINQFNHHHHNHHLTSELDNLKASSLTVSQPSPSKPLDNDQGQLINLIRDQLKYWIDSLGVQSAEAQNLKEPITCHTRFIQGSFRSHSPLKHKDLIYFLVQNHHQQSINHQPRPSSTIENDLQSISIFNNGRQLTVVGFIRIGFRNLFLQHAEQLVNVNQCFSILDFYITRQRQGLGKLLISCVLNDQTININKCAFDRPTQAMVSFLGKHFNLGSPQKQHNRFVIYNGFFN